MGDSIRMVLKEIGLDIVDRVRVAQNTEKWWAVVNTVMNLNFP